MKLTYWDNRKIDITKRFFEKMETNVQTFSWIHKEKIGLK